MAYQRNRFLKSLLSALDAGDDPRFTKMLRLFLLKHGANAWRVALSGHPLSDDLNDHAQSCLEAHFKKAQGYVYVAANPMLEGFVKVGVTAQEPSLRMKSLTSAGVVGNFFLLKDWQVSDKTAVEAMAHRLLSPFPRHKEFFKVHWSLAFSAVDQAILEFESRMGFFILNTARSHPSGRGHSGNLPKSAKSPVL